VTRSTTYLSGRRSAARRATHSDDNRDQKATKQKMSFRLLTFVYEICTQKSMYLPKVVQRYLQSGLVQQSELSCRASMID